MIRNRLSLIVRLLLIAGIIVALPTLADDSFPEIEPGLLTYEDPHTGVILVLGREAEVFPQSWRSAPVNGQANALDESEYERSLRIIKGALDKYPAQVVIENLETVYWFSTMDFFGNPHRGANDDTNVYMTNGGEEQGYTDYYLERVLHSEFSSILLRKYDFAFQEDFWRKINPNDFSYGPATGEDAMEIHYFLERGFLSNYGCLALQTDFGSFAESLFRNDGQFWEFVDEYPKIEEKMELTVQFYHQITPVFTEEYFQWICGADLNESLVDIDVFEYFLNIGAHF